MKVFFTTVDGSEWLLDGEWVQEQLNDFVVHHALDTAQDVNPDSFSDFLLDQYHAESYEDWLFPNARLNTASASANILFDLGDCEEDLSLESPYENGWKFGDFNAEDEV